MLIDDNNSQIREFSQSRVKGRVWKTYQTENHAIEMFK